MLSTLHSASIAPPAALPFAQDAHEHTEQGLHPIPANSPPTLADYEWSTLAHGEKVSTTPVTSTQAVNTPTSGVVGQPADHAVDPAFMKRKVEKGCTYSQMLEYINTLGGRFLPSASAGRHLLSPNDHVGVVKLPVKNVQGHHDVTTVESLAIVVDTIDIDGSKEERYYALGYGNRLVSLDDLAACARGEERYPTPPRGGTMETSFRTLLRNAAHASELYLRPRPGDSTHPVMPVPPSARALVRADTWANAEPSLIGFGPVVGPKLRAPDGPSAVFRLGYLDYNQTENRLLIFLSGEENVSAGRPVQTRRGVEVPASVNINGPIIAQIQGIKGFEVMAPIGLVAGIKGASIHQMLQHCAQCLRDGVENSTDIVMRITTEDLAVHELTLTDDGVKMRRILPAPVEHDPMTPLANAAIDVYSYEGRNTGPNGSVTGYANPHLILSTRDALPAGPLIQDPTGAWGGLHNAGITLVEIATKMPSLGNNPGASATFVNTTVETAATSGIVFLCNALLNELRGVDGTLLAGATPFSSAGAGPVSSGHIAATVALVVPAQRLLTELYERAYKNFWPETAKVNEDSLFKEFANEFMWPMVGEFGRMLTTYGMDHVTGLPRGGPEDVACLAVSAFLKAGLHWIEHRTVKYGENHPHLEQTFATMNFLLGDLLPRAYGAAASRNLGTVAEKLGGVLTNPINYAEAMLSRVVTRSMDRAILPMVGIALNQTGIAGPNATAYRAQLSQETRVNDGGLQALAQDVTQKIDHVVEEAMESVGAAPVLRVGVQALKQAIRQVYQSDLAHQAHAMLNPNFIRAVVKVTAQELQTVEIAARKSIVWKDGVVENMPDLHQYMMDLTTINDAKLGLGNGEGFPEQYVFTNSISDMPPKGREVMEEVSRHFLELWRQAATTPDTPPYPLEPSPDFTSNSLLPEAVPRGLGHRTPRAPRNATSFTNEPDLHMRAIHRVVASQAGFPTSPAASKAGYRPLTPEIVQEIYDAQINYSLTSTPFHYLLRWDQTGQPEYHDVVPGIRLSSPAMNKVYNATGEPERKVTPREVLMMNLGALHAEPFFGPTRRAVVSEAEYANYVKTKEPTIGKVSEGELVSFTEIFSTTSSTILGASFLAPQGMNAAAPERRLIIVLDNDGNIPATYSMANLTELKQAETITMPGTLFKVENIVSNPPKVSTEANPDRSELTAGALIQSRQLREKILEMPITQRQEKLKSGTLVVADTQITEETLLFNPQTGDFSTLDRATGEERIQPRAENLGQVVRFKRLNAWEMEVKARKLEILLNLGVSLNAWSDGTRLHINRGRLPNNPDFELQLEHEERIIDPESGNFYIFDAKNCTLKFDSDGSKNYFLGRPIETQETQDARWRHPYTSQKSTRGMRDWINMTLLTDNPRSKNYVVPFLDDMTENVTYASDRAVSGQYTPDSEYSKADQQKRVLNAKVANDFLDLYIPPEANLNMEVAKLDHELFRGELLAELTVSALRRPLTMVNVSADGHLVLHNGKPAALKGTVQRDGKPQERTATINNTFDAVDLQYDQTSPAALIGVGPKGYYRISFSAGEWQAHHVAIDGEGPTYGNFLHAVNASCFDPNPSQYELQGEKLKTATGHRIDSASRFHMRDGIVHANDAIDANMGKLFEKLINYAKAPYLPMQLWLCQKAADFQGIQSPHSLRSQSKLASLRVDNAATPAPAALSISTSAATSSTVKSGKVTGVPDLGFGTPTPQDIGAVKQVLQQLRDEDPDSVMRDIHDRGVGYVDALARTVDHLVMTERAEGGSEDDALSRLLTGLQNMMAEH